MTLDVVDENPKDEMRREAVRVRSLYVPDSDEAARAVDRFIDVVKPRAGQVIAVYYPVAREMDTLPLVEKLVDIGVTIALPKMDAMAKTLTFLTWDGRAPLPPGPYGIPEPVGVAVVPDVIVAPLLAFDRRGTRLGTGGGYYDRSLAILRENGHKPLYVGWAYAQQMCLFPLPRDDHDIPMDMVITPQATHDFRG